MLPSSSFHSWPLLAISSPLGCSSLCAPYPPDVVWICQTHSFTAFLLPTMPPGVSLPCKELGKEMGQPQGWERKGELVLVITGESKQVLEALGHCPRATTASLLRPGSSSPPVVQKSGLYSAQHFSPSHYNDKGDKRFLSQCSESI